MANGIKWMKPVLNPTLALLLGLLASCAPTQLGKPAQFDKPAQLSKPARPQAAPTALAQTNKHAALLQASQQSANAENLRSFINKANEDPDNPEPLYNLGYLHMQSALKTKNLRERELAINYFNEVLTMVPGNQAVLQALYNIYYDDTLHNRSADAFANAKQVFMQLPDAVHSNMNPPSLAKFAATALWQEQQHQPNRQELRGLLLQAMQESPKSDNAYIQLAKIYSEDRYFALALATLKLGTENIQNSVDLYNAIANTYSKRAEANGCNYERSGDIAQATQYYKLAVPLTPDDQNLHYNLSRNFFDQNLPQLALNEAEIGLSLAQNPESLATNAQNYSMLGFHQQAHQLLQQAIAKGYPMTDAGYHEIFMNEGDWQAAANSFDGYIKARTSFSVYDLIKSDLLAEQTHRTPWVINQKISLANDWEEALFNYWTAKKSADELKKLAHTRCEKTEYYFYTGYRDYQAGQIAQAKTKFGAALNQNTYRFIERPLARYFLQKLSNSASVSTL